VLVMLVAGLALLIQTPGLARRDEQDRSIEFWLSQPVSHSASIGATLLMHFVLVPLLALAIGYVSGQLIGTVVVMLTQGVGAWFGLPLGGMFVGSLATFVRVAFGLVLAVAWIMPLLLLAMVASAWLKRWGVPVLGALLLTGHLVGTRLYGVNWVADALGALRDGATHAVWFSRGRIDVKAGFAGMPAHGPWPVDPGWLLQDAWGSVTDLAQPSFVLAVLASAACFALLAWRRSRVS